MVSVAYHTHTGMCRATNEDALVIADLSARDAGISGQTAVYRVGAGGGLLMAVSDGLGGAVAGEIASQLAVTVLHDILKTMSHHRDPASLLKLAIEITNWRVYDHAEKNPELTGMGTTLTAVLVQSGVAYIAQVGDSRAYLLRGDRITQITRDQTLAQLLLDGGIFEPGQYNPARNHVLIQALGTEPSVQVALSTQELRQDDHLLICSDGLSNKVRAQEIERMVRQGPDLPDACRKLIDLANERGGEDNITVILARLDKGGSNPRRLAA